MSSSESAWMPAQGPHPVNVGSSLSKSLKVRKGTAAPAKRSNLPDREFYSFRYNFKPESIDPTKPGTIEVKKGKEKTSVTVERASTQNGEAQLFQGGETDGKEVDCILIYDEELGTFTLEKLDSFINLTYDRKIAQSTRPSNSPAPTPSESASPVKKPVRETIPSSEHIKARAHPVQAVREEEEEEGSELETETKPKPKAPTPPSRPVASTSVKPRPTPKPINRPPAPKAPSPLALPSNSISSAVSRQGKPAGDAKVKAVKRDREQSQMDQDDTPSTKPSRPAKTPRPSPPPKPAAIPSKLAPLHLPKPAPLQLPNAAPSPPLPKPATSPPKPKAAPSPPLPKPAPAPPLPKPAPVFALPNTSRPGFVLPFAGTVTQPPPEPSPPPPVPRSLPALTVVSDSEDEWDEVETEPAPLPPTMTVSIAADEPIATVQPNESDEEEMDIDMTAFEQEMNEHLGGEEEPEEEDFLAAELELGLGTEPLASPEDGIPMSLNQYAGGDVFGDDDYSSSSDESD